MSPKWLSATRVSHPCGKIGGGAVAGIVALGGPGGFGQGGVDLGGEFGADAGNGGDVVDRGFAQAFE